ncbi:hypothetical protein DSCW_29660 [Desulfosarcina widdelii]|uniref:histidine kinase n=1 Tax=Desulfosarcina widdelii TaxID=947919 RepID=A0A5K7Z5Q6_9BACT|nr:PAS domain S-box protein [Desulfosarcina widdelii]BBO75549.1 hypothetical protein DSCW_29660 [Desulfosarcina widdelii]
MVSGTDLFYGLFNNMAIFIVLIAVYGFLISTFEESAKFTRQALVGFTFGLFAIGCMYAKIPVAEGVVVDQRNAIITLCGAFGGPLSAVIGAFMAGTYRINLGGAGALSGVIGVGLSALGGTVLYNFRDKIDSIPKAFVSALAATLIVLPGWLFYKDIQTAWALLKAVALPYGLAIFFGIFFVGLLLARQEHSHLAKIKLIKSEERLRESEQRLDLALSGANEGIWDWNLQNNTIHFDKRYYTISGYSPNEFPANFDEWELRVHPDDIQQVKSSIQNYLSGEIESYDNEFRFKHKDGHYMWIQGKGKIVARNDQGEPVRFIGTHSDITLRKQTEDSLRITRFIFDKASIGIYRIGSDAMIIDVNRQAALELGYTVDELHGMSIFDIDPHTKSDEWGAMWQSLCETGSNHFERIHRRKDGSDMFVEITTNLLEYEGNQFSVAFTQNITERKIGENNLKASERRYQDLFNEAPIGYVVIENKDGDPYIKNVNKAFLNLIGYNREEILDTPLSRYYTETSRELLKKVDYQRAFNGVTIHEERDLLTREKKIVNTILHVHPIYEEHNKIAGARAMFLDITDRKNAEKEAKRLELALLQAQKMEAIGTLAGGIAHDFNNILGAIIGYTELAQIYSKENPKIQEYTKQIFIASERAKGLIQQILAFSRQTKLEKQPLDIGVAVKETLKLLRASIPRTIEMQQDIKTNIGAVYANQTQIHQVVLNLCTNAAHAMEKKGGKLSVDLHPIAINENDRSNFNELKPGLYIKLMVTDTGHGMDNYTISRIFDPYYTTKEVGEGTGMGLALVHGIVKDHGGDIKVYSELGVGTAFHILFPTIEGNEEKATTEIDPLLKGKGNILFVDDEKPLVDIGKDLLEFLGYQVETRTSPIDALEALRAKPDKYDLVITDMTMPNMNGDKLVEEIKQFLPKLPIIICTGFSKRLSQDKKSEMGIDSILMKPLTLNDLATTVKKVLDETNQSINQ